MHDGNWRDLAALDRVIHEPGRLMIVALLYSVKEADFLYLLNRTEMSKGNLSSHLAKLEETGYIKITKTYRGKIPLTICELSGAGRSAFERYRRALKATL